MPHDVAVPDGDGDWRPERRGARRRRDGGAHLRGAGGAGEYEYVCSLHSRMMRGVLEVR